MKKSNLAFLFSYIKSFELYLAICSVSVIYYQMINEHPINNMYYEIFHYVNILIY